jgi:nucleoside-diphosphate-sugar epimerase
MIEKIAVLGCGWLGFPLAKSLVIKSFFVNGSTTSIDKVSRIASNGIAPFLINLGLEKSGDDIQLFLDADLLIINIPPGRGTEQADDYEDKISALAKEIEKSTIKKVIFISSTSVYPEINDHVDETYEDKSESASAKRMLAAEEIIKSIPIIQSTIIRMAGLIGPNRHPGRFFSGKENIPAGLSPVNLIHLEDCIGVIEFVIENNLWDQTFNAAAPSHPLKTDFYDLASQKFNGKSAQFLQEEGSYKIVDSAKIISEGYQFKHPDLMKWLLQNPQN